MPRRESMCHPVAMPTGGKTSELFSSVTDENNLFFIERDKTSSGRASFCAEWNSSTGRYYHFLWVCGRQLSLADHVNKNVTKKTHKGREALFPSPIHTAVYLVLKEPHKGIHKSPSLKIHELSLPSHRWSQQALNITDHCRGPRPKSKRPLIHNTNRTETILKDAKKYWMLAERPFASYRSKYSFISLMRK